MASDVTHEGEREIGRLTAALGDPTRRSVFFALRRAGGDQTKDDIGAAVGIERRLAGFHLDKLVEHGFATASSERPRGARGGPGRPAKRYRIAHEGVLVARPERHYEVLASLLLRATGQGGASQDALERVGFEYGLEMGLAEVAAGRERPSVDSLGQALDAVARLLSGMGFSAAADEEGAGDAIALRACACPFEELAFDEPGRICGLDRAIWRGMIAAFAPDARVTAEDTRAGGDDECLMVVEETAA